METLKKIATLLFFTLGLHGLLKANSGSNTSTSSVFATIVNPVSVGEVDESTLANKMKRSEVVNIYTSVNEKNVINPNRNSNYNSAVFCVTGKANSNYSITIPDEITLTNGRDSMMVKELMSLRNNGNCYEVIKNKCSVISEKGIAYFNVQGVVNISKTQIPSSYTGSIDISIDYP